MKAFERYRKDINEFFSPRCAYCQKPNVKNLDEPSLYYGLCKACSREIKRIKTGYCKKCGNIFSLTESNTLTENCDRCSTPDQGMYLWHDLKFFGVYEGILQDIIKESKFYENLIFLRTLADIISPIIKEVESFDFIVPMPLHTKRLQKRGYNQCLEIVKHIEKKEKIPYNFGALEKVLNTNAQSSLSKNERFINLKNSFKADKKFVDKKKILLFDDVSTTGSSLNEATKALLEAGAEKVFVLYIAGTAPEQLI